MEGVYLSQTVATRDESLPEVSPHMKDVPNSLSSLWPFVGLAPVCPHLYRTDWSWTELSGREKDTLCFISKMINFKNKKKHFIKEVFKNIFILVYNVIF